MTRKMMMVSLCLDLIICYLPPKPQYPIPFSSLPFSTFPGNTREASDIPNEIKKLGEGYCDTDNKLDHLNECVKLYGEYCKTDLLMEENDDICKYLGYGGDDVVMAME